MKNISVRWKISLFAGTCTLLALLGLGLTSLYFTLSTQKIVRQEITENIKHTSTDYVAALASDQAQKVKAVFNTNHERANMIAHTILFLRKDAEENNRSNDDLRASLNTFIQDQTVSHRDVLGIYVVMEQNALDNSDSLYTDNEDLASNDIGRFAPYWARSADGSVELEVMYEEDINDTQLEDSGVPYNEWYICPVREKAPCVLDPYLDTVEDTEILMTSVTVPIFDQNKVIGMVGIDISLESLQPIVEEVDRNLIEGHGDIALVSPASVIAAIDTNTALLGEIFSEQDMAKKVGYSEWQNHSNQKLSWNNTENTLQAFIPVELSASQKPWGLVINAPGEQILKSVVTLDNRLTEENNKTTLFKFFIAVAIGIASIILILISSGTITRPLIRITEKLQEFSDGNWDLSVRLPVGSRDEIGKLNNGFNQFIEKLQSTVQAINESVESVQLTAGNASEIAGKTSYSSRNQIQEVEQVATAMAQLTESAESVARNTEEEAHKTELAKQSANNGISVANSATDAVSALVGDVTAAMPMVETLSKNSENIESILAVIQEIAEQTNLLALNAAIEAARAGEHGRGFAVVATEVRTLAERTQESIGQIRSVIEQLQSGTRDVQNAMEGSNDKANAAVMQVEEMLQTLQSITLDIQSITEMGTENAAAATEQSQVAKEMLSNISRIKDASHQMAEQARASEQVSSELNTLSIDQKKVVEQFKV